MDNTKEMNTSGFTLLPFDPIVLVQDVMKRWLVIVLAVLMVGVGTYIATDLSYKPVYKTNATFVVTTQGSSTTVYSNLSSTSSVAGLFTELLNSSIMRKTIMAEMGVTWLDATVSTAVIENTNLITMTVSSSNPRTAFLTAQTIIDKHEQLTYSFIDGIVIEVLQYPSVPMSPSNSVNPMGQMKKMALIAALASAAGLAFLSFRRNAVRSSTEAREKLDCSYLGEIPHENKYKTLLSRLQHKKSSLLIDSPIVGFRFVETFRKLRRRIEHRMNGRKVLMVTSLLENEGKSTIAVNLALAMAKKHQRVLLIDCDLRKPACHLVLDRREFGAGIKEILQGEAKMADAVLKYNDTNLDLLLARRGDRKTCDLITSQRMNQLLERCREHYDCIILDLPPMTAASDAEGMTGLADACLLVVRQNAAVTPALNKAIAALEGQRAKLLGCVLNNVYSSRFTSSGGYGYDYRYGGYRKYGSYDKYGYGKTQE